MGSKKTAEQELGSKTGISLEKKGVLKVAENSTDKVKWLIIGSIIGTAIGTTVSLLIQHVWKRVGLGGPRR